jgi:magnesium transporter
MPSNPTLPSVPVELRYRFLKRHKLMEVRADVEKLADRIRSLVASGQTAELQEFLHAQYPADIADALYYLNDAEDQTAFEQLDAAEAAEVLDETDGVTLEHLVHSAPPERLAAILVEMASDEAAHVLSPLTPEERERVLAVTAPAKAAQIRKLLSYSKDSAGSMMALEYVAVPDSATQTQAVQAFLDKRDGEHIFYIFTTGENGALKGMVDLRTLLSAPPETIVRDLMLTDIPATAPETDREQVANIFAHYDLMLLPVVEQATQRLLGVITADDVIDVVVAEDTEDALHMAGSDAEELEKRSPVRIAFMRLP